jgi:cytoskeletal protein CcmA (bactofilin family)
MNLTQLRFRLAGAAAALAVTLFALVPAPAYALQRESGDTIVVPANQTVDDDWAAAGRFVRIDGTIHGDAYVLANSVRVTGIIDGDLLTAAQEVIVDGTVRGNVRAAGSLVQMNGAVDGNVTSVAHLVELGTGGRVGRNVISAGDTVAIDGDVGGKLSSAVRDLIVQGHIGGGAEVALSSLTLGPDARIGGDLTYYSDHQVAVPAKSVGGQVHYQHVDTQRRVQAQRHFVPGQVFHAIANFLSLAWLAGSAVVGLLLLRLVPRFVAEFLGVLESRPLPSLGLGVLILIATLPAAVLIGLTIIGVPLAGLLVAGYFSGIFVGWLLLAVAVGSILVGVVRGGRPWHHSWSFLLGLLVLFLVTRIPILGGLLGFAGAALSVGALVLTLERMRRGPGSLPTAGPPLPTPSPAI